MKELTLETESNIKQSFMLLNANFFRLRKGRTFYVFLSLSALFALGLIALTYFMMWMNNSANDFLSAHMEGQMEGGDLSEALENLNVFKFLLYGFDLANGLGIVAVIAIALFAGREYSTGIIRNKIIAGHSRSAVYLSSCAAATAFAFAIMAVYALVMLAVGLPMVGLGTDMSPALILRQYLAGLCITAVSATVANCVALLSRNNIAAILINLGVVYGLVVVLSLLDFFAMVRTDMQPFIDAVKSLVYVGQFMLIGDEFTLAYFLKTVFSSVVSLFVINAAGCAVFNKLDIK
jgi:ABC-type transport system involved in multi-copper enzyme maturation permease subunit